MELGLDISTLAVAIIAGGWTYWTWKQSRLASKAADDARADRDRANKDLQDERLRLEKDQRARKQERQKRQDELDERKFRHRDITEAHAIHKELTSRPVYKALQNADSEPDRSFLLGLHQRLDKRLSLLMEASEESATDGDGIESFTPMITERLEAIREATTVTQEKFTEKPTRDFTKYLWRGRQTKFGKGGALNLIGARFTALHGITTVDDFVTRFGAVVKEVLRVETAEYTFDPRGILIPLLHEGQRERYAVANRRWRDAYGNDGVMTLDGDEYLVSWDLGFTGARLAPLQKKLIAHFAEDPEYPIIELARP